MIPVVQPIQMFHLGPHVEEYFDYQRGRLIDQFQMDNPRNYPLIMQQAANRPGVFNRLLGLPTARVGGLIAEAYVNERNAINGAGNQAA